jgi:hypothetical protein
MAQTVIAESNIIVGFLGRFALSTMRFLSASHAQPVLVIK